MYGDFEAFPDFPLKIVHGVWVVVIFYDPCPFLSFFCCSHVALPTRSLATVGVRDAQGLGEATEDDRPALILYNMRYGDVYPPGDEHSPPGEEENHLQKWILMGYVSSQEGMYKQLHGMRMGGAIRYIFVFFFWSMRWKWWHEKTLDLIRDVFVFLFLTRRNCWERHLGTTKYYHFPTQGKNKRSANVFVPSLESNEFQSVCFFFQSFKDISSMVNHKYGECGLVFAIIFSKSILQLYCHYALLCRFGVSGSSWHYSWAATWNTKVSDVQMRTLRSVACNKTTKQSHKRTKLALNDQVLRTPPHTKSWRTGCWKREGGSQNTSS